MAAEEQKTLLWFSQKCRLFFPALVHYQLMGQQTNWQSPDALCSWVVIDQLVFHQRIDHQQKFVNSPDEGGGALTSESNPFIPKRRHPLLVLINIFNDEKN